MLKIELLPSLGQGSLWADIEENDTTWTTKNLQLPQSSSTQEIVKQKKKSYLCNYFPKFLAFLLSLFLLGVVVQYLHFSDPNSVMYNLPCLCLPMFHWVLWCLFSACWFVSDKVIHLELKSVSSCIKCLGHLIYCIVSIKFDNSCRLHIDKTFHKDNLKETWVWKANLLGKQILSKSIIQY